MLKRDKSNKFIFVIIFLIVTTIVSGCSSNKSSVKTAQINQVVNNKSSLQENASYDFKNGNLNVNLTFFPFKDPNLSLSDTSYDKSVNEEIERINKEFPTEKITKENFNNNIDKTINNVTLSIDKKEKKVRLNGKDIDKEFRISDSNENRLIDSFGVEYEFSYEK